jgi:hypothetical protein
VARLAKKGVERPPPPRLEMASDMAGPTKERLGGVLGVGFGRGTRGGIDVRAEEEHLEQNAAPESCEAGGAEVGGFYFAILPGL